MNKYIAIWFCINFSTSVKVHETNFNKFFENKMAAQNLANKSVFLDRLLGRTTTGRNFALRTKNEKDSKILYENEGS